MQRIACHDFAEKMGWTIVMEKEEKGVSGFKVSATKRDAIQELKDAASKQVSESIIPAYRRLRTWAMGFDTMSFRSQKMIVNELFSRIELGRDYKIHCEADFTYKQFCTEWATLEEKINEGCAELERIGTNTMGSGLPLFRKGQKNSLLRVGKKAEKLRGELNTSKCQVLKPSIASASI